VEAEQAAGGTIDVYVALNPLYVENEFDVNLTNR
jgi:hypothetical protein